MVKIEIEPTDAEAVLRDIFDVSAPQIGQSADLDGLKLTNMTAGADNIDAPSVLVFVVENHEALGLGVAANVLYAALSGGARALWVRGKRILSKEDLEAALDEGDDQN